MITTSFLSFSARIEIIDVNPYVLLPEKILLAIFEQGGKDKGPIPIKGSINGHPFVQTLVRFRGAWRLYLNTPMRRGSNTGVGDTAQFSIAYDPARRSTPMHPKLKTALKGHDEARKIFDSLPPSRKKEILRYINNLKTTASIERNVDKALGFLLGRERFIGRDHP